MSNQRTAGDDPSRRHFLKQASIGLAGAAVVNGALGRPVWAADDAQIKIGLVGCGGRGTGAVLDALGAATKVIYPAEGYHTEDVAEGTRIQHTNISLVGLADLFEDRLARAHGQFVKLGIDVPKQRCFTGFDAYEQLLAIPEINYVILATPPHFRPQQLKAALEAGKHVFMEKPAAVDVPGVRLVMGAGELAASKGLGIAAGTQRRHDPSIARQSSASRTARSASSSTPSATGTAARSGSSIVSPAGATWSGSSATGITSPGSAATTSSSSTCTTWTS